MTSPQPPQVPFQPPVLSPQQIEEEAWKWRTLLVRRILQIGSGIGAFVILFGFFALKSLPYFFLYLGLYIGILVVSFGPQVSSRLQTYVMLAVIYGWGILALYEDGLNGDGRLALLALPMLAVLLLGVREGIYTLGLSISTLIVFVVLYATMDIPGSLGSAAGLNDWISATVVFTLLALVVVTTQSALLPRFLQALAQLAEARTLSKQQAEQLQKERLATQKQARLLEMNTSILKHAENTPNLKEFLDRAVQSISQHYGVYHVGVFLLDETGEHVALRAASSATGQNLVATGFVLHVSQAGSLTETLHSGHPRVISETRKDTTPLAGPQLVESHSEMLLPLRMQDKLLGALDIQNREVSSFDEEDLATMQMIATLLAVVIYNLRATSLPNAPKVAPAYQSSISPENWKQFIQTRTNWGYRYDPGGITPLGHTRAAATQGSSDLPELSIPITMRDKVIGVVKAHKPAGQGQWNQTETALMSTLADQLSVALESARLFEETQRRAAQERLVSEVTSHMRQSLDVDTVLRTAVSQIRQALNLESAEVRLEVNQASQPAREEKPV